MTLKKHVLIAALAILLLSSGAAIVSAQTSTTTDPNAVVPTSVTTPGTPNTGAGGNSPTNWLVLGASAAVVLGGVAYLVARPRTESDY